MKTDTTNREELLDQYIDAATRLEQCEKLRRYDVVRSLQNELYDHQEQLEERVRKLKKALEEIDDDN